MILLTFDLVLGLLKTHAPELYVDKLIICAPEFYVFSGLFLLSASSYDGLFLVACLLASRRLFL